MKALFAVLALTLALSVTAHANDGGMAYIDVQGVNPTTTTNVGKTITVEDGSVIEFYGKDAEKFMRLLPSESSVMSSMVPADQAETYQDFNRGLLIASKNYGLYITCSGAEAVAKDLPSGETKYTVVKSPQVKCQVSISKSTMPKDEGGDIFPLNTKDKSQRTCN